MRDIENFISPFVESQFPAFYQEEGPLFILFVKEYYKWMEETDNTNYYSRNLFEYRDIDKTIDEFIVHFKEKYLQGVDFSTLGNKKLLIKGALDLFRSKGTERSMDLLFKLVYGAQVKIYTPGSDILKPSDGTWVVPKYLEVTRSARTPSFVGKQISGSKSGATAFVEYVITRDVEAKVIDVIYLSNLVGNFTTEDIISENGIVEGAPKVTGSLSFIDVTVSGQDFTIGEIVNIVAPDGIEGKARVTDTFSQTGLVSFTLIDGGWGYSTTANLIVSSKVLTINSISNSNSSITGFFKYDTISQTLTQIVANNVTGSLSNNDIVYNGDGNYGYVLNVTQTNGSNSATIMVNPYYGNILSNSELYIANTAYITTNTAVSFSLGDVLRQSNGSSNVTIGTVGGKSNVVILTVNSTPAISANGLHVGTYVIQSTSGATGYIAAVPRESHFGFTNVTSVVIANTSGTFNNSSVITAYPSSSNLTLLATATPNNAANGYLYKIINVAGTSRWSTGNTVLKDSSPTTNTIIKVATDVGGIRQSNTVVTATANAIGVNSTAIGLSNISNTFYIGGRITGLPSNTSANVITISTGQGAVAAVGTISDSETVRLSPDLISSNNDGPGTNSVSFANMLISGANSTYGNLSSVYVFSGGTGYSNTNKVVFTNGYSGVGSFGAGNATITTDASGIITAVSLSANVGNSYISTPTVSVVNSSGGSTGVGSGANLAPIFHYGFIKLPMGDASYKILDLLRFETRTIGTIFSLSGINPGENYNTRPFINVIEPSVAAYGKQDFILKIGSTTGTFIIGEVIQQVNNTASISITSNNYSGNTSASYEIGELVNIYNGASIVGNGFVFSSSLDIASNNYTTVLTSNTGSFTNGYFMVGTVSKSNTTITNSSACTSQSFARARIQSGSNSSILYAKRISLFTDLNAAKLIYGTTSGASANVVSVTPSGTSPVGDNAIISSNVVTSSGSIAALEVVDSGFGYESNTLVSLVSEDGLRVATGRVNLGKQGTAEGYYSSTRGFLDEDKYIFDGRYYQEYSYEVQSSIPLETYSFLLKQLMHVAGTEMFGRLTSSTNLSFSTKVSNSSITIS